MRFVADQCTDNLHIPVEFPFWAITNLLRFNFKSIAGTKTASKQRKLFTEHTILRHRFHTNFQ